MAASVTALDRRRACHSIEEAPHARRTVKLDAGRHIHHRQTPHQVRRGEREFGGDDAAQRHAGDMQRRQAERCGCLRRVRSQSADAVIVRPGTFAMTSHVERDQPEFGAQADADIVPGSSRERPAMQQQRRRAIAAPIERAQANTIGDVEQSIRGAATSPCDARRRVIALVRRHASYPFACPAASDLPPMHRACFSFLAASG